ncbi:MAG: cytidine deaminase [Anaerolineae bacterium]
MTLTDPRLLDLVQAAAGARVRAYAPYSGFRVGAAVLTDDGRTFTGANVENASYGLTMCAERVATFAAVTAGARGIVAVAVSAEPAVWPCGACLQVLAEFANSDCVVAIAAGAMPAETARLGDLLPRAFDASFLRRQEA